jgi:AraC family transcriptional regulator
MDQTLRTDLPTPRFVDHPPLLLAGIAERYRCDASAGIPGQWQRFMPQLGHIPQKVGRVAYGVNFNGDESGDFDYLCGVEVRDFGSPPATLQRLRIRAQRYAVFTHAEHVSTIRRTHHTIWTVWLPTSGCSIVDAPFFERYDERFDGASGLGGVEIWLPVERQA